MNFRRRRVCPLPFQREVHVGGDLHQLVRQCQSHDAEDVAGGPVIPEVLLMDGRELKEVVSEIPYEDVCFHYLAPSGLKVREDPVHVVECRPHLLFEVSCVEEVALQIMGKLPRYPEETSDFAPLAVPVGIFPGKSETENGLRIAHFFSRLIVEGGSEAPSRRLPSVYGTCMSVGVISATCG